MSIQISLLSVCSAAILLLFCACGYEVALDGISSSFSLSDSHLSLDVHPTWLIYVPQQLANKLGGNAMTFGNVMVFGEHLKESSGFSDYVYAHERIHITQFRALGWLIYPAQSVVNIEPADRNIIENRNDPTYPALTMWQPPSWWKNQWSFMTITIDRRHG